MASRPGPDFGRFLGALSRALEAGDLPFMVIGGQAVLVHGQPRLTQDIDITLGVEPAREFAAVPGREGMGAEIERLKAEA